MGWVSLFAPSLGGRLLILSFSPSNHLLSQPRITLSVVLCHQSNIILIVYLCRELNYMYVENTKNPRLFEEQPKTKQLIQFALEGILSKKWVDTPSGNWNRTWIAAAEINLCQNTKVKIWFDKLWNLKWWAKSESTRHQECETESGVQQLLLVFYSNHLIFKDIYFIESIKEKSGSKFDIHICKLLL